MLLLHGLCGASIHFDEAFSAAPLAGRELIAVDLPGHGDSRFANAGIDDAAEACYAVLNELKVQRPWVAAHSFSSSVAVRLLDKIRGLVLLEGNLLAEHLSFSDRLLRIPEPQYVADFDRLRAGAEVMMRMQTSIAASDERARYAATYRMCDARSVRRMALETNAETRAAKQIAELRDWHGKVIYFAGEESYLSVAALQNALPRMTVQEIPKARHFVMLDNPTATFAALAAATHAPLSEV